MICCKIQQNQGIINNHRYFNNSNTFAFHRNEYFHNRVNTLASYFNELKIEFKYKCSTDKGYIKTLRPLSFTEIFNEAYLLNLNQLNALTLDFVEEQIEAEVPLLDIKEEFKCASELIWLDNNIVSKKTYYDVCCCEPTKQVIRNKIANCNNQH